MANRKIEVVCQILNLDVGGIIVVEEIFDVVGTAVPVLNRLIFVDLFHTPLTRAQDLNEDQRAERAPRIDAVRRISFGFFVETGTVILNFGRSISDMAILQNKLGKGLMCQFFVGGRGRVEIEKERILRKI